MTESVISLIDVCYPVKTVAGCIQNLWRTGMSKSPKSMSNFPDSCCYGYWKSDNILTKFNEKC